MQQIYNINVFWQTQKNSPIRIGVYFKAGGIYQGVNEEGIAHLVEHLLLSNPLVKELSNKYFVTIRGYTTKEFIYIHIVSPHHNDFLGVIWPKIIQLFTKPIITAETISQEAVAIKSELANFDIDYPNTNQVILHDYLASGSTLPEVLGLVEGNPNKVDWTVNQVREYLQLHVRKPSAVILVGDIPPTGENFDHLFSNFENNAVSSHKSLRLRKAPIVQKVEIHDDFRQDPGDYVYIGLGWSQKFTDARTHLACTIFFAALTNPDRGLYKLLRDKESLLYDFLLDQDVIDKQISIYSIHTLVLKDKKEYLLQALEAYLQDKKGLYEDVQWQLNYYKITANQLHDGSLEVFNFYDYYQRISITIDEYEQIIDEMTVSEILDFTKDISTKNAVLLLS